MDIAHVAYAIIAPGWIPLHFRVKALAYSVQKLERSLDQQSQVDSMSSGSDR